MSYSIVQHIAGQSASSPLVLPFPFNVTAGNLLIAFTVDNSGGALTIMDNLNGVWAGVTFDQLLSTTIAANIQAFANTHSGACTVTFSIAASLTFMVLMIAEVSGVSTSSFVGDNSITNQGFGGAHPSVTVDSLAFLGDFVFSGMYLDNSSGSAGIGFATIDNLGGKFVTQWHTGGNTGSELTTFNNSAPSSGQWLVQSVCWPSSSPSSTIITHPSLLTVGVGR